VRGLIALVVVGLAGTVAALALAVSGSRDPVPGALKDCVREGGGFVVRGQEGLAPVRADLLAGELEQRGGVRRAGRDRAVLLEGLQARVLVLASPQGASLDVPDLPTVLYRDPSRFSAVVLERDPVRGLLERCLGRAAAE
jgi:hypothetical protein